MALILIIEDDVAFCKMLTTFLERKNFEVKAAFTAEEGIRFLETTTTDLVITDVRLPDMDGLAILDKVKTTNPALDVILMTGYAEVDTAVSAMKRGAFDYISKPVRPEQLLELINKALNKEIKEKPLPKKQSVVKDTPSTTTQENKPTYVKGVSDASAKLNQYIDLVSPTDMSVLIIGDSGTGKEYVAKSIHDKSKRANNAFIPVDCGAIPKEIASSEFFGHVKGSFTGAVNDKVGHFEAANGGTLFLDEIGNLTYELQVQLLRALQERKIKKVGSNTEIKVDIRVIAATNENLEEAVKNGEFREDLYHRLNEFSVQVPRLKDRKEDLMLFANLFLTSANQDLDKEIKGFSEATIEAMTSYSWPGNLRELKNIVKRSVLLTQGDTIPISVLPRELTTVQETDEKDYSLFKTKNEQRLILDALEEAGGNKSKAARILNIDRKTLYNKLKQYDIKL